MCGIVGFFKLDTSKGNVIPFEAIEEAFKSTSLRGMQATGFYSPKTGTVKSDDNGEKFAKKYKKELRAASEGGILVGHCRAATAGIYNEPSPPSKNENNHPHEGKRFVLVHNGHFGNLPLVKNYKYKGNCDSEIALSYIETFGLKVGIAAMSKMDTFSLVIYDKKLNQLFFYRETSPLVYSYDVNTGHLLFGSTTEIVMNMASNFEKFGLNRPAVLHCWETTQNYLYGFEAGKEKLCVKIELRNAAQDASKLKDEIKSKLDVESFFGRREKNLWENGLNSRHTSKTTSYPALGMAIYRGSEVYQAKNSDSHSPQMVYTTIENGVVRMFGPLLYAGSSTFYGN